MTSRSKRPAIDAARARSLRLSTRRTALRDRAASNRPPSYAVADAAIDFPVEATLNVDDTIEVPSVGT